MIGPAPCEQVDLAPATAPARCADAAKPWVLAATILGSSMAFIDGSVVTVALPAIQANLGASVAAAQWVVNAYALLLGALILLGGAAGDRFGRRKVFALGIALFALASAACGLAPNAAALVAARAAQGVGGALLVPSSLAIISASFPDEERGRAIGTWAGFSALTTALGPVLGGWLVDAVSWRAIFLINLPVALLALGLTLRRVPESRGDQGEGPLDWAGGALATLGLGALAFGLTEASDGGWLRPTVLAGTLAGALVLALFVAREARARAPMMPLGLFRSADFSGANAVTLLLYAALGGALFFLPFNLIQVQGYSATAAGAAFLPLTLILSGLSRWSGGLAGRYGARAPLTAGPLVAAAGYALLALPGVGGGSYWTTFFPGMATLGLGMAVSVAPLTTTVMGSVAGRHAGVASGVNNATARVAGMLAVALLGAVAVGVFGAALRDRVAEAGVARELGDALVAQAPRLAQAAPPPQASEAERRILQQAIDGAFVASYRLVMLAAAALALLSALCACLTIGGRRSAEGRPAPAADG